MIKQLVSALGLLAFSVTADDQIQTSTQENNAMQSIQLNTANGSLAANLYLPEGVEKPPVVIVTGAWTTVKEQMPANYAEALVKQGYAAVTFDFRGWGESGDKIKYLEDPARKTSDIEAVADALTKLGQVDASRIGGLGICASSGYMLDAALASDKIQSVAVVAPWLHDKPMATAIYGGEESVKGLLGAAEKASNSATPIEIEAASLTNESALMYQAPYYTETDRGLIPEYDNKFNVASWSGWLNYDAQLSANQLKKPVLMVASEAMALPGGAHQYLDAAGDNVKAVWLKDVNQFQFYDQPKAVSDAVDAVAKHFGASL